MIALALVGLALVVAAPALWILWFEHVRNEQPEAPPYRQADQDRQDLEAELWIAELRGWR